MLRLYIFYDTYMYSQSTSEVNINNDSDGAEAPGVNPCTCVHADFNRVALAGGNHYHYTTGNCIHEIDNCGMFEIMRMIISHNTTDVGIGNVRIICSIIDIVSSELDIFVNVSSLLSLKIK